MKLESVALGVVVEVKSMLVSCGSVVANRSTSSAKRKLVMRLAFVWPSCMLDARVECAKNVLEKRVEE